MLRKAEEKDIPALFTLIEGYAAKAQLLRRSEESLRAGLSDFTVYEERGEVVACGALMPLGDNGLGEIRSLAVRETHAGKGIGRLLVEDLMREAPSRGFTEVIALTRRISFFEALGFQKTQRELYLDKIQVDCRTCPLNLCCDETAVRRPVLAVVDQEGALR